MPYMTKKREGKWNVFKKGPDGEPAGDSLGEHDTPEAAREQVQALYANEDKDQTKEADHTKCGYSEDDYIYVPWGVTSFADLEAAREAQEAGKEARKLTSAFSQIASNIMGSMDISNKAQALTRLANEFTSKIGQTIRGKEAPETKSLTPPPPLSQPEGGTTPSPAGGGGNSLLIWKENDTYKWVAAYSNNYRDEDNPPEIISAQSHKEFDQALEKGDWPMPEAWLWHIPYPVGQATVHAFDEGTGFTLSAGEFYPGMDWAAEGVISAEWNEVSHGMPSGEIERDEKDNSIITRHRTREISFLPKGKAANKLAFSIISKETDMALPAHKRPEFVAAFGEERVAEMEKTLEAKAGQAKEAGIEQKEQGEQAAAPEATPTPEAQQQPQQAAVDPQALAQAITTAVTTLLAPVVEEIKSLQAEVKELKKTDAEKVAEKAAATPAASLEALVLESIFSKATQVDGRESLAKSKPKETQAKKPGGLFFDSWVGPAQQ